LRALPG